MKVETLPSPWLQEAPKGYTERRHKELGAFFRAYLGFNQVVCVGDGDSIKKILMSEEDWVEGELPSGQRGGPFMVGYVSECLWHSAEAQAAAWPLLQALPVQR